MDFRVLAALLLGVLVSGWLVPRSLSATPLPEPAQASPSPDALAVEYERTLRALRGEEREAQSVAAEAAVTPTAAPIIIRGEEGIPFPSPTEVVMEPLPTFVGGGYTATPTPLPTATPWQKPGRCQTNETIVQPNVSEGNPQEVWYDLLFLHEDLVPLDPDEVFGDNVTLYPYGAKSGDGAEILQEVHAVPCVPYRVRQTARETRLDFGNNALKNYSADQTGRGMYHSWIEQKLFGSSVGRGRR